MQLYDPLLAKLSASNTPRASVSATGLGLGDVRFHDLRHTHATVMLLQRVHPKVVQERLGHSKMSTTMDIYSHVVPSMQKEAVKRFAMALEVGV